MKFKKLLSAVAATAMAASAFAGLAVTASAAETTKVITFNGKDEGDTDFFTNSSKHSFNTKFTGAEYDGVSYTSGLKMESATTVSFTTAVASTVTIVQSTWESNGVVKTIKFDGTEIDTSAATAGTGCLIYTFSNVTAGDHVVSRGNGESGIFCIKVVMEDSGSTEPKESYNITVNPSENGSVSAPATAEESSRVTLKVEPDDGYELDTITVTDDNQQNITVSNNGFTMPSANVVVDATFKEKTINYVVGSTEGTLVAASETKVYNFLADALAVSPETEKAAFIASNYYYNDEVYVSGYSGLLYYSNKTSANLDGTTNKGGIRLKSDQDAVSIMLAPGATVEVPVYGGGSGDRTAQVRTDNPKDGTVVAETGNIGSTNGTNPQTLTYTNNGTEPQVIHITATGDSFFSQIKVTVPGEVVEPTAPEATVTYVGESNANVDADAAFAYYATIKTNGVTVNGIKWTINATQEETDETPATSGEATVYYGLILTAPQGTTQPTVEAEAISE